MLITRRIQKDSVRYFIEGNIKSAWNVNSKPTTENLKESIQLYEKAISRHNLSRYNLHLGISYYALGEYEKAISSFNDVLQMTKANDKNNYKARFGKLKVFFEQGKIGEAIRICEEICAKHPDSPTGFRFLAELHFIRGNTKEAFVNLERFSQISYDFYAFDKSRYGFYSYPLMKSFLGSDILMMMHLKRNEELYIESIFLIESDQFEKALLTLEEIDMYDNVDALVTDLKAVCHHYLNNQQKAKELLILAQSLNNLEEEKRLADLMLKKYSTAISKFLELHE